MGWANNTANAAEVSSAGSSARARAFGVASSGPASCGAMRRMAVYTAPVCVVVVAPASITLVPPEGRMGKTPPSPPYVPPATHAVHRGHHDGALHRHAPRDLVLQSPAHSRYEAEHHASHRQPEEDLRAEGG